MKIIENDDGSYIRQWKCACNRVLETDKYTAGNDVDCLCGRLFNSFGQQLQDPDNWHDDY
jgi:hypothetical protein